MIPLIMLAAFVAQCFYLQLGCLTVLVMLWLYGPPDGCADRDCAVCIVLTIVLWPLAGIYLITEYIKCKSSRD